MHLYQIYIAAIYEKKEEPWEITCRSSKCLFPGFINKWNKFDMIK